MKRRIKIIVGLIIGMVLLVILLVIGGWYYFMGIPKKSNKIEEYGNWPFGITKGHMEIFPQTLSDPDQAEYQLYYRDGIFGPSGFVYLKCSYHEADYQKEEERLKTLQYQTDDGDKNAILYDTENFRYPAYVAMHTSAICEYALVLEEEHSVVYIRMHCTGPEAKLIEKEYWPVDGILTVEPQDYYNMYDYGL